MKSPARSCYSAFQVGQYGLGYCSVLTHHSDQYPDANNTPSVTYEPNIRVRQFPTAERPTYSPVQAFAIDLDDPNREAFAIRLLLNVINGIVNFGLKLADHTEEELFSPIPNTTLPPLVESLDDLVGNTNNLIDIDQDSDNSTDGSSSGGAPCLHWTPKCKDISILSREIASEISNLTECILYREYDSQRVKIMNGNIQAALDKLTRLEPLLVIYTNISTD